MLCLLGFQLASTMHSYLDSEVWKMAWKTGELFVVVVWFFTMRVLNTEGTKEYKQECYTISSQEIDI